jgi:transcriptional regulator with XRE-family HTH domain
LPAFLFYRKIADMDGQTIARIVEKRGLKKSDLASALGIPNSAVTQLLKGERRIKADEVAPIRQFLRLDTVPLKGFASAGGAVEYHSLPEDELDRVQAPEDSTENTVAVEIRGDSLGPALNGWLAYYDDVHRPVTGALANKLCVLGLSDGAVVIKRLVPSKGSKRMFHLVSNAGEHSMDVPASGIAWGAKIIRMQPK